jgi:hypothetical protein
MITRTATLRESRKAEANRLKPLYKATRNPLPCHWKYVGENAPKVSKRLVRKPNLMGFH